MGRQTPVPEREENSIESWSPASVFSNLIANSFSPQCDWHLWSSACSVLGEGLDWPVIQGCLRGPSSSREMVQPVRMGPSLSHQLQVCRSRKRTPGGGPCAELFELELIGCGLDCCQ